MPIPPLSPYRIPDLLCPGCGNKLRPSVQMQNNGKVAGVIYYCDPCQYGFEPSLEHASGTNAKYVPPQPVEEAKEAVTAK